MKRPRRNHSPAFKAKVALEAILRWLHKKHPDARMRDIAKQYGWHKPRQRSLRWRDGDTVPVSPSAIRVVRYQQSSDPGPAYA